MNHRILLVVALLLAACLALIAQGSNVKYVAGVWFTLGPTLQVSPTGQLDVAPRVFNRRAVYDPAAKAWILPVPASNLVVTVEGLRYEPGVDYAIAPGRMTALSSNMLPEHTVVIDYDPR